MSRRHHDHCGCEPMRHHRGPMGGPMSGPMGAPMFIAVPISAMPQAPMPMPHMPPTQMHCVCHMRPGGHR